MKINLKKSGLKLKKSLSRFSRHASEDTREHIQENIIDRISHIKNVKLLILEWSLLVASVIFLALTQAYLYNNSYATESYTRGGTYTEGTIGKINSLNPLFAMTDSEETLARLLFASLTNPDYSGHIGGDLAKSVSVDKSGKVWTVKLHDNLKWSDGEPITNEDVLYTVGVIQDPNTNTNYRNNLASVTVEEKDGAINFTLRSPNAFFKSSLDFPILPKHLLKDVEHTKLLENVYSQKPTVTSGAFYFNASQNIGTEGEQVVYLNSNEHYYKGKALLDSFVVHAYTNKDDVIKALNAGTITASAALAAGDQEKVTSSVMSRRESALDYGTYAFFNLDSPTMKNKEIRQAIQKGIDMKNVRSVTNGEPALDFPISEKQLTLDKWPELPKQDTEGATKTIAEFKKAHPDFGSINIVTIGSYDLPDIANKLSEELKKLGIENTVSIFEPNQDFTLNILSQRSYDILIYEIGLGVDPDVFPYYHSSQTTGTGLNFSNYKNAIVNDLILSARNTIDADLRKKKYENFLNYFVSDVPAIGITQSNLTYFVNNNVRTFSSENSLASEDDRFADVHLWSSIKTIKNRTP